ncbi:MAG: DUF1345 domain-containing protein [Pseudomonadota bacterium]|nr:DUF1345 domain-containing protein [Pseudomonadota bacterium]
MTDLQHVAWYIRLSAASRIGIPVAASVILFLVEPATLTRANRLLVAWDVGVLGYLGLAWLTILRADSAVTHLRARSYDQSAYVIFLLVLAAAFVSVVALVFLMGDVKQLSAWNKATHLSLSVVALILSWVLIHTVFTFHYAREFYVPEGENSAPAAGLQFPECDKPAYLDFAYYSFVIGMTSQVSDVAVASSAMRRTTLAHGVLSFIFNIAVLALSVNVISGVL